MRPGWGKTPRATRGTEKPAKVVAYATTAAAAVGHKGNVEKRRWPPKNDSVYGRATQIVKVDCERDSRIFVRRPTLQAPMQRPCSSF
jgi:hypothetical protein